MPIAFVHLMTSLKVVFIALLLLFTVACGSLYSQKDHEHSSVSDSEISETNTVSDEALIVSEQTSTEAENEQIEFAPSIDVDSAKKDEQAIVQSPSADIISPSNDGVIEETTIEIGGAIYIDDNTIFDDRFTLNEAPVDNSNLWLKIKRGFAFPTQYPLDNAENTQRVSRYLTRFQKSSHHFKGIADSARPYLFYIVSELEKNNIPLEIALLPIVESRYDPFAYSPGRAAGLWQFIPSTGKRFGLTQDWWQDERRDTIAATGAAIQYLLYLHNRFDNDWLLALAAYNAGQGNVAKAIRKNKKLGKPTDYWSLDLPKETRHYVPQLLAWREFINEASDEIIASAYIANAPYFDVVDVGTQIDLAEAARLADTDIDTVYQLNPTYSRWATDPEAPHHLLVPVDKKSIFEQALGTIPNSERITWDRYVVRKGDVLGTIAEKFSTNVGIISSANNLQSNVIRIGQTLLIPSAKEKGEYYSKSVEQRLARSQNRSKSGNGQKVSHKVKAGESLWGIGKRYGVSANAIARWNNMAPKDVLSVNQTLVIWQRGEPSSPQKTTTVASNEKRKLFYRVRNGDSLSAIASRFNVGVNDIKNWNSDARSKYIQPGQLLTLYVALTNR